MSLRPEPRQKDKAAWPKNTLEELLPIPPPADKHKAVTFYAKPASLKTLHNSKRA